MDEKRVNGTQADEAQGTEAQWDESEADGTLEDGTLPDGEESDGLDVAKMRRLRLTGFLRELVRAEGRMEAAELLGVAYRTLVKAEESGELTGRMSDALERLLGTGEDPEAAKLRERVGALEEGVDALAKEMRDGLEEVRAAVTGVKAGDSEGWFQEAAGDLPANPAGVPGRLNQGGDGLRPQERGGDRPGAAPLQGEAVPEGEGPHRHGGGGADGGPQGAGLRDAHRHQGHYREDGRHAHPARVPGGGDEGRRRCPGTAGGVGGRQGEAGNRRDDLPPQAGADGVGPHRLPNPDLVRN